MIQPKSLPGSPSPLGFSLKGQEGNFALFSHRARHVQLGLFSSNKPHPDWVFPLQRSGDIWHIGLEKVPQGFLYGFCIDNSSSWICDPRAKILETTHQWGEARNKYLAKADLPPPFDWKGVSSPEVLPQDLIVYEMHMRGFTKHTSSAVSKPGTYLGAIEKIPYLKKLGINAVELMPVYEFDEMHSKNIHPVTKTHLPNYWGYSPLFYFAPMQRYAFTHDAITEFKTMVREFHRNGIQVFLDVVYNHTGEGKQSEPAIHFRAIDDATYYMIGSDGVYLDYTGCGNTVNTNHPIVQELIFDSLKFWAEEMHVDGFRFDLASIFTRDLQGHPIQSSQIVNQLSRLQDTKWIAEPWDAAGLYQVGFFPNHFTGWSDWNGVYRDSLRRFLKGTSGKAGPFARALSGSEEIYRPSGKPFSSINFVTAHDGYSLRDLVSYQSKHNKDNGEMNQDGNNNNDSWNCGAEGPTSDGTIQSLRERQMRNFFLSLFLSQGTPMLLMGDEYGHTRHGNNNPYVQDNEINWFLWDQLEKNQDIFSFVSGLIAFRKKHKSLRRAQFLTNADVDWHGKEPFHPDWSAASRLVAYTLKGSPPLYVAFNAGYTAAQITLPPGSWREVVNTGSSWAQHCFESEGPLLSSHIELIPHSAILAFGKSI